MARSQQPALYPPPRFLQEGLYSFMVHTAVVDRTGANPCSGQARLAYSTKYASTISVSSVFTLVAYVRVPSFLQ